MVALQEALVVFILVLLDHLDGYPHNIEVRRKTRSRGKRGGKEKDPLKTRPNPDLSRFLKPSIHTQGNNCFVSRIWKKKDPGWKRKCRSIKHPRVSSIM
jgi:hypothetical protein